MDKKLAKIARAIGSAGMSENTTHNVSVATANSLFSNGELTEMSYFTFTKAVMTAWHKDQPRYERAEPHITF